MKGNVLWAPNTQNVVEKNMFVFAVLLCTAGQDYLDQFGYVRLVEIQSSIAKV